MLLCLSHCRSTIKKQIEKATGELEQLQKFREETASSPRDQRYMPTNMGEAQLIGALDHEEAVAARAQSSKVPRHRTTPKRRCSEMSLASPIRKSRG